ncbi:MAG: calcium/sodium antiporter [Oscillospiraceae bacterium]|nr:calcium/sodium antiporter [Oscillospiraceae bacterium]
MFLNILLSALGFAVLLKCADFFVEGASSFAKNLKIPTAVIGLTVVAFGTSAPELAISFSSRLSGNTDILYGNVIGSNIANILFILGFAVVIIPFEIENDVIKKEIPILLLITMGLSVLFLDVVFDSAVSNSLSRADGVTMILFFSIFIYYLITLLSRDKDKSAGETARYKTPKSVVVTLLGLIGIILGSNVVVENVAAFAASVGISQKIISVTIIAVGTSLPELVTTVTAAKKGENNMAIGNIVGSNIFNICVVLGLPVALLGEAATAAFGVVDMVFMLMSVVLLWIFSSTNRKLKRYEAGILISVYCAYCVYIFAQ